MSIHLDTSPEEKTTQKQRSRFTGTLVLLCLLTLVCTGVFGAITFLNRASAKGTTYSAELLPFSEWGWADKDFRGKFFMSSEDSDCTSGLYRNGCLCWYRPFAVGPILITRRAEQAYP